MLFKMCKKLNLPVRAEDEEVISNKEVEEATRTIKGVATITHREAAEVAIKGEVAAAIKVVEEEAMAEAVVEITISSRTTMEMGGEATEEVEDVAGMTINRITIGVAEEATVGVEVEEVVVAEAIVVVEGATVVDIKEVAATKVAEMT